MTSRSSGTRRRIKPYALALIVSLLATLLSAPAAPAAPNTDAATAEAEFLGLLNDERSSAGLGVMSVDSSLVELARGWSGVMANDSDLRHNPDLGSEVEARLGAGVQGWAENIAYGGDVRSVHDALMASPGHRKNILGRYTRVGVGVVVTSSTLWVTFDFASVQGDQAPPPPVEEPTPTPEAPVEVPEPPPEPPATTPEPPPTTPEPPEPPAPEAPTSNQPPPVEAPETEVPEEQLVVPTTPPTPLVPVPPEPPTPAAPPTSTLPGPSEEPAGEEGSPTRPAADGDAPPAPAPPSDSGGGDSTASPSLGTGGFPASLRALMDSVARSGSSSSASLVEALASLGEVGMDPTEAAVAGFGRFPVAGRASYSHDWWFPRFGPGWRLHQGTDMFAAMGTPVRSPSAGVVRISQGGLGGLSVKVVEPDATYWYLAHLAGLAPGLVDGAEVEVGQVLAYTGNSGNAAGGPPHVHVELHPKGGGPVDPKAALDGFLAEALAEAPALVERLEATNAAVPTPPPVTNESRPTAQRFADALVLPQLPELPEPFTTITTSATRPPDPGGAGLDVLALAGLVLVLIPKTPRPRRRDRTRAVTIPSST